MTAAPARIHRLRHNAREGSPHRLLIVDSEADIHPGATTELQTLKLWAAVLIHRHGRQGAGPRYVGAWGRTAEPLVELVERSAGRDATLWVAAHNLSYDLTLTRVLLPLLRRGWVLTRHNLASEAPWALLRRRSVRIRLVDTWSWLPEPLARLGERLGIPKLELPTVDAALSEWLARCQQDVAITVAAFERLLDQWDRLALGWWSLTGPASAWNSFLHRQGDQGVTVDPDPAARAFERRAVVAGRREIWRKGTLPAGPYSLLDFALAHLTVCATLRLPVRRGEPFERLELTDWRLRYPWRSVVAEAVVRVETPRYPLRARGAVLHPVGTFQTVLAGPELLAARERGELLAIGAGYSYRLGDVMQPWARWALAQLEADPEAVDPILQVFLKMASRTVPGRWGMLVSREQGEGASWIQDWALERAAFGWPPKAGAILHLNGRYQELVRDQESDDSFPAVLAHIQSWVRLGLSRAIDALPAGAVLQCNTDALLVPERVLWAMGSVSPPSPGSTGIPPDPVAAAVGLLSSLTAPLRLRVKSTHQDVELESPQHLRLDGARHYAGIPASARELEPNVFQFWSWPKLAGQLERAHPEGYLREQRTVRLDDVPVTRWVYQDGCCEPPAFAWSPERGNAALGPNLLGCAAHGAPQRQQQHPALGR